uniref:hypothetical protein n=1 Tax=Enterococcus mundtii TaxID=53346 RepID=UPI0021B13869|nr:hypothetical protein [Enterococcus mundtii]
MDELEDLLNELRKTLERWNVQTVGIAMQGNLSAEKKTTDKTHKDAVKEAENSFSSSRDQLENSLKGGFAKKVIEVFDEQEKELKVFE